MKTKLISSFLAIVLLSSCALIDPRYELFMGREDEAFKDGSTHFTKGPYIQSVTENQALVIVDSKAAKVKIHYGTTIKLGKTLVRRRKHAKKKSATGKYFTFPLRKLSASQEIFYMMEGYDDENKVIERSLKARFVTAPSKDQPFSFIAMGSNFGDPTHHQLVVDKILKYRVDRLKQIQEEEIPKEPLPELLLHTGNLTSSVGDFQWNRWFRIERQLLARMPIMPVMGNLTTGKRQIGTSFRDVFRLPGRKNYYSYRYGSATIIGLDTENLWSRNEQYRFLVDQLQKSKGMGPVVIVMHRPVFTTGPSVHEARIMRPLLHPLFKKYGVDLVLSGHEAFYERTKKLDGVVYVNTGGGGSPLYTPNRSSIDKRFIQLNSKAWHFMVVNVKDATIHVKTVDYEGNKLDEFKLKTTDNG